MRLDYPEYCSTVLRIVKWSWTSFGSSSARRIRMFPELLYSDAYFLSPRHLQKRQQVLHFRSTPPSRPNNIRGGNVRPSVGTSVRPSVRPSVRTSVHKSLSDFNEIWCVHRGFGMYIQVDEWCTMVCRMTRFKVKVKVKVTGPLKFRKLHFSKSISSATYRGSWQMTTDS